MARGLAAPRGLGLAEIPSPKSSMSSPTQASGCPWPPTWHHHHPSRQGGIWNYSLAPDCWRITCWQSLPSPWAPPALSRVLGRGGEQAVSPADLIWAKATHPSRSPSAQALQAQALHLMRPLDPPGCPAQDGRRRLTGRPLSSHGPPPACLAWGLRGEPRLRSSLGRGEAALPGEELCPVVRWDAARSRVAARQVQGIVFVPLQGHPTGHLLRSLCPVLLLVGWQALETPPCPCSPTGSERLGL